MRSRFLIGLTLIVLALLVVIFWLRPSRQTTAQTAGIKNAIQQPNVTERSAGKTNPIISQRPQPSILPSAPTAESRQERIQNLVQAANAPYHKPVHFYGKVIDQNNNPLLGVRIVASILHEQMSMPTPSGDFPITNSIIRLKSETGLGGRFEITGEEGRNLTIESIQKDGYEVEPDYCPHTFDVINGTSASPVIFRMWGTNLHEPLITGEKKFQIVPDGRAYFINFNKGTITESGPGDLKLWVKRPANINNGEKYDWSCEIDLIDGGLCQSDTYSMFSAPATGYVPSFHFEQRVESGWADTTGERRFYLRLRNGQMYGRLSIELEAYFNNQIPGMIRLSYAINPSGSRALR